MNRLKNVLEKVTKVIRMSFSTDLSDVNRIKRMSKDEIAVLKSSLEASIKFMEIIKVFSWVAEALITVLTLLFEAESLSSRGFIIILALIVTITMIVTIIIVTIEAKLTGELNLIKLLKK